MNTNDERLANKSLALAEEIKADLKRELDEFFDKRVDALIAAATDPTDFNAVAFLIVETFIAESRVLNAAGTRANAVELKPAMGVKN